MKHPAKSRLPGKLNFHPGSLSLGTVNRHFRPMQKRAVLYNGQSKTGSAGLLGMTLIHSVKTFEYTLLMFFWNTDASICHDHFGAFQRIAGPH